MSKVREAFRQARRDVNIKDAMKHAREARGFLYFTAKGKKQRDDLLEVGWEVISQDVSESGAWVTQWFMRRQVEEEPNG